jgi:hypothetical protein
MVAAAAAGVQAMRRELFFDMELGPRVKTPGAGQ